MIGARGMITKEVYDRARNMSDWRWRTTLDTRASPVLFVESDWLMKVKKFG